MNNGIVWFGAETGKTPRERKQELRQERRRKRDLDRIRLHALREGGQYPIHADPPPRMDAPQPFPPPPPPPPPPPEPREVLIRLDDDTRALLAEAVDLLRSLSAGRRP